MKPGNKRKCSALSQATFTLSFSLALMFAVERSSPAAIIGTNPPAQPLTVERIEKLPAEQRDSWIKYLERSKQQLKADQNFLQAELKAQGLERSILPPSARSVRGIALDQDPTWYASDEGRRIAGIVVSFQTPAGGWSKNLDMTKHRRAPGEHFASDNVSHFLASSDNDTPHDANWSYVGTFDNDATITQMRFLAKVIAAVSSDSGKAERAAFLRGLEYIFAAQYPNGGWPQVWPLEGGYHDGITYNDDAMLNVIELLNDVGAGRDEFAFAPQAVRARARAAVERGMECILATQIVTGGRRTVWCQQHDALTLQPASARNYEMPSECSAESATLMMFLMKAPNPGSEIVASVHAAAAWFEKTKISDIAFRSDGTDGRQLVSAPGEGPLWSRYYEIGTDRPIFGDRDKTIHDQVNEISKERRQGYGWYRDTPKRALEHYAGWKKEHAEKAGGKAKG